MKIIFATRNIEKLKEAKLALAPFGHEVEGRSYSFIEPTEGSLEEIAKIKLSQIEISLDSPVIVDDSGIFFESYPGFPGILTRRVFNLIGYKGIDKLLKEESRKAFFHGVIAVKWKEEIKVFEGKTHGVIIDPIPLDLPKNVDFPFDPIFKPDESDRVFGQMAVEERVYYSYRRKALEELGKWMNAHQLTI